MRNRLLPIFLCFFLIKIKAQDIIPQPVSFISLKMAPFQLTAATTVGGNTSEAKAIAKVLADKISAATGYNFTIRDIGNIQLNINKQPNAEIGDEGYTIESDVKTVKINANKKAGLFYGVQSLLQLMPKEIESKTPVKAQWTIPYSTSNGLSPFCMAGVDARCEPPFFLKS